MSWKLFFKLSYLFLQFLLVIAVTIAVYTGVVVVGLAIQPFRAIGWLFGSKKEKVNVRAIKTNKPE